MQDTLFTKIIRGEIPCHKIYEDDRTFAFLDIHPLQPGHVLVVPKCQVEFVWDMEDADYQAVMATVKKIALRLREVLAVPYVSARIVGVDVPHAHVHLIPFSFAEQLGDDSDPNKDMQDSDLADLAKRLML